MMKIAMSATHRDFFLSEPSREKINGLPSKFERLLIKEMIPSSSLDSLKPITIATLGVLTK